MKTYRFHFNTQYATDLRDAVNDRQKQSIDNIHTERQTHGEYCAWDRTCAAMDRLEDTIHYLNSIELGRNKDARSAFDFYDFINNAYIVIDCIKTIGKIFRIDNSLIEEIENSTAVFGKRFSENSTDKKFFEYIRSLCSVHPLCTNHQKEFLNGSNFHCCPFVSWKSSLTWYDGENADLTAFIYPSDGRKKPVYLGLYVSQFEKYLTEWIDFIPKIIEAKNTYTDKEYEKLRKEPVKYLSEFKNDVVQYLMYLKTEYCKRFDYGSDYLFDAYATFFSIKLSDARNNAALEKYQNAVIYSLDFLRNELQNMSFQGYENNGLKHPEDWIETTLFDELYSISTYGSAFSAYSYNLEKVCYLGSDIYYSEYDKLYARNLLEGPKELINRYVHFTNSEPDEERIVLVYLASYFEALTRKNLLNKNIPNTPEYRMQILSEKEYNSLLVEDAEEAVENNQSDATENLLALLKEYGG